MLTGGFEQVIASYGFIFRGLLALLTFPLLSCDGGRASTADLAFDDSVFVGIVYNNKNSWLSIIWDNSSSVRAL